MLLLEQFAGEYGVVHRGACPQVETAVRALYVEHAVEDRQHGVEFLAVEAAVGAHMDLVVPGGDARQLGLHRHGAAGGCGEEEFLQDLRVAGDEARAQAGQVGRLDRLWNTTQRLKSVRPSSAQALSRPGGGAFSSK